MFLYRVIILLSCSVACGFAHSLVVVDRTNAGDQLDLKSKEAFDPEDEEENNNEEDDDDSDSEANVVAEKKSKRGGKAFSRGHGRGRPPAAKKEDHGAASAKRGRGRPKKA
ncbi:putative chromatin remodeling & transcriptional activation HMG family [Helianthus anomalus]